MGDIEAVGIRKNGVSGDVDRFLDAFDDFEGFIKLSGWEHLREIDLFLTFWDLLTFSAKFVGAKTDGRLPLPEFEYEVGEIVDFNLVE